MFSREEAIQAGLSIEPPMLDAEQLGFLYDLAAQAPSGPGCEVGVFRGSSLVAWLMGRPEADKAAAIDSFELHGAQMDIYPRSKEMLRANVNHLGLGERVAIIEARSATAARLFEDKFLAFLFVDGDHTRDGIGEDIKVWPQKVMPGGIIVFHDYGSWKSHYYVTEAVDEWQAEEQWEPLGMVGSAIAFRRPKEINR